MQCKYNEVVFFFYMNSLQHKHQFNDVTFHSWCICLFPILQSNLTVYFVPFNVLADIAVKSIPFYIVCIFLIVV